MRGAVEALFTASYSEEHILKGLVTIETGVNEMANESFTQDTTTDRYETFQ